MKKIKYLNEKFDSVLGMARKTPEHGQTTIRLPVSCILQVDRIARDEGRSRNDILSELVVDGLDVKRGMSSIKQILNDSRNWLDNLVIDKVIEKLKGRKLSLFEKAYLAYLLDYQQRVNLFEKLELNEELDQANMIDNVLYKSKEKRENKTIYNLYEIANNITITLTDFGIEYLRYYLGDKDIGKLMEIKPEIFSPKELESMEEIEEEYIEEEEIIEPEED